MRELKSTGRRWRAVRHADAGTDGDDGFTLIELLVVLLIIGILLAIAIPTFLSVTKGANNTAAQSNLQTALTGADTYYTQSSQTFSGILTEAGATASTLTQIDTGLSYSLDGASSSSHVVSVHVLGAANNYGSVIEFEAYSPGTNDCWGILEIKSPQTTSSTTYTVFGETQVGTYYFVSDPGQATSTSCNAAHTITTGLKVSQNSFPKD